jgi:dihydroflavonol-4-reductase
MRAEKVLVTGADGMLGSHIVSELVHRGYPVRVMIIPGSKVHTLDGLEVEVCHGDILNISDCTTAMQTCTYVIHAAASTSTWPTRSRIVFDINFTGTQNMVSAAQAAGVRRFIYISSASSFGPGAQQHPADETTPFHGAKYKLDYVDSKHAAHEYVMEQALVHHFPAIVICPTFMIGPNDINLGTGQFIVALSKGKLPFVSGGGKNFVYVRDVAAATVNALEKGRLGEAYIAGHSNMSYWDFTHLIGKVIQAPPPRFVLPDWIVLVAGWLSTLAARIFGFHPMLNLSQARASLDCQYYDPGKTIRELDLPQTDLTVAVQAAYEWLKKEGVC